MSQLSGIDSPQSIPSGRLIGAGFAFLYFRKRISVIVADGMDIALLIFRLFLSAVLGVAGVAKLYDRDGSRQSFTDFGVPDSLVRPLAWLLPVAEILTAIALIPTATAWLGGVSALVLLSVFSIGIATKLARGEAADCHCFGTLQAGPIGWHTLVRNVAFTSLAGIVAVGGWNGFSISALTWAGQLKPTEFVSLVLSVAGITLVATVLVYVRRLGSDLSAAMDQISAMKKVVDEDYAEAQPVEREGFKVPKAGLPVGAPSPSFLLENLDDELVGLDDLLAREKPVVLLFVSPKCPTCKTVLASVEGWQRDFGDTLTLAVLSKGTKDDTREKVGRFGTTQVLLQGHPPIGEKYKSTWTPTAVLINAKGKIASSLANGDAEIGELIASAGMSSNDFVSDSRLDDSSSPAIGELAPEFSAPDLNGNTVSSSDLWGRDTLMMFWNPDCSWCAKMIEDVRDWEANPPKGAPALVILAAASEEEVSPAVKDIQSLVLLDVDADIAHSFGSTSTPTGIVIDQDGRIASGLVAGVKGVLALAGVERVKALIDSVV